MDWDSPLGKSVSIHLKVCVCVCARAILWRRIFVFHSSPNTQRNCINLWQMWRCVCVCVCVCVHYRSNASAPYKCAGMGLSRQWHTFTHLHTTCTHRDPPPPGLCQPPSNHYAEATVHCSWGPQWSYVYLKRMETGWICKASSEWNPITLIASDQLRVWDGFSIALSNWGLVGR